MRPASDHNAQALRPTEGRAVSSRSAKHRKSKRAPSRNTSSGRARHRKPSVIQAHPAKTAAAVTGAVLVAAAAPAVTHWSGDVGVGQAAVLGRSGDPLALNASSPPAAAARDAHAAPQVSTPRATAAATASATPTASAAPAALKGRHHRRQHHRHPRPAPPVYQNPLRAVGGLVPERVDQGVDFGGTGPIYAIGDGVVTDVYNGDAGWPGGGWVSYRLTDGPAVGLTVFVAEDVTPTVAVGQAVNSDTVICNMFAGGAGIETGWAWPGYGDTALSSSSQAGGISGSGPFPTQVGVNFDELLMALGVPASPNRYDSPYGILPAGYSPNW